MNHRIVCQLNFSKAMNIRHCFYKLHNSLPLISIKITPQTLLPYNDNYLCLFE
jgi:hypothetical protein